ncbi:DUF6653 family protein [Okeania sp.]|uniref:DUF6653 family protein n=1 Tax=Okeania sp. TaxID=3100323 RepID=UPI002B4B7819|nr:DUF6653 family protein [Okeania sp.]
MTTEQKIANLFQMTDEVWARYANPWSGLTRFSILLRTYAKGLYIAYRCVTLTLTHPTNSVHA